MNPIRVMLVDDHALVRAGISSLLSSLPEIEVVAEAGDSSQAVPLIEAHCPDVVMMDINLPGQNGLEFTRQLVRQHLGVRVIMLSMHDAQAYVREALRAGAAGYLLKDAPVAELELAIRAVARGDIYLTPAVSKYALDGEVRSASIRSSTRKAVGESSADTSPSAGSPASGSSVLTLRQQEIVQLVAQGKSTQEIARLLALSPKTVEAHRAQLMERLGIYDVPGLVRYAIKTGLCSLDE